MLDLVFLICKPYVDSAFFSLPIPSSPYSVLNPPQTAHALYKYIYAGSTFLLPLPYVSYVCARAPSPGLGIISDAVRGEKFT